MALHGNSGIETRIAFPRTPADDDIISANPVQEVIALPGSASDEFSTRSARPFSEAFRGHVGKGGEGI